MNLSVPPIAEVLRCGTQRSNLEGVLEGSPHFGFAVGFQPLQDRRDVTPVQGDSGVGDDVSLGGVAVGPGATGDSQKPEEEGCHGDSHGLGTSLGLHGLHLGFDGASQSPSVDSIVSITSLTTNRSEG